MTDGRQGIGRRHLAGLLLPLGLLPGTAVAQAPRPQRPAPQRPPPQRPIALAPALPCADRPGDICALLLRGTGAPSGTVAVFGQAFRPGDLPRGAGLAARLAADGRALPVQVDVNRRHADGSARFAVVAIAAPALAEGQDAGVLLARGAAPAEPPLDLAAGLGGREVTVEVSPAAGGAAWRADLVPLLRAAPAAERWQSGPLAVQARIERPVPLGAVTSLRLVADLALRADGSLWLEAWLRNDIAMRPGGGDAAYTLRIVIDGHAALEQEVPRHWQYAGWGRLLGAKAGRAAAAPPHGRQDPAYLAQAAALMPYDLSLGVDMRLIEEMERAMSAPEWQTPFHPRGLQTSMGAPGARPDIGQTTNWQAAWIMSGDLRAEAFAIGQAEAGGGIPWHYWDPAGGANGRGGWLDIKRYPNFWTDARGGAPPQTLMQPVPRSVWQGGAVRSHQPNLFYVPYLLTGRRAFLDGLTAQAAWNVVAVWPHARRQEGPLPGSGLPDGNLAGNSQVRSAAWTLRTLDDAAWIAPDADPNRAYLEEVTAGNFAWMRAQIPHLTEVQGGLHGRMPSMLAGYASTLSPWQQDYMASTVAKAALRGREDARVFLDWMRNFLVGRFFATDQGFPRNDAVAYQVRIAPHPAPPREQPPQRPFQTWAEMAQATREAGISNGDGWRFSNGEYGRLAMLSLGLIAHVFDDPRATEAWQWLASSTHPYTSRGVFERFPYHAVAPPGVFRVPDRAPRCTAAARG